MRTLLGAALLLCACDLPSAPPFGQECRGDGRCPDGLICHAESFRCVAPLPADEDGRSCEQPLAIAWDADTALLRGRRAATPTALNTSAGAISCHDGTALLHFSLEVPPPPPLPNGAVPEGVVLRVSADAPFPVGLALASEACTEKESACAAPVADAEEPSTILLPLVTPGAYRVIVALPVDDVALREQVTVRVEQVECPAGFLPDGDGCRGFVELNGPAPRVGHAVTPLSSFTGAVVGGRGRDGEALSSVAYFDRRALAWREGRMTASRERPCSFVLSSGELAVLGGGIDLSAPFEVALTSGDFTQVANSLLANINLLPESECAAASLSGLHSALVLGGSEPWLLTRSTNTARDCSNQAQCVASDRVCAARFGSGSSAGFCVCPDAACDDRAGSYSVWIADAPRALFRASGVATLVSQADIGGETVFMFGGIGLQGPIAPMLFDAREQLFAPLAAPPIARVYADAALVGTTIVIAGGFLGDAASGPAADAAPGTEIVDLVTLTGTGAGQVRMARARRDAALASFGADEAIVIGGRESAADEVLRSTEIVDVRALSARVGPTLPFAVHQHRALALGDETLVVGGRGPDGELVERAALLVRAPRGVVPPDVVSPVAPLGGDRCESATSLDPLTSPVVTTTYGQRDSYALALYSSCGSDYPYRGRDTTFRVSVPADHELVVRLTPISNRDLALATIEECGEPSEGCGALADRGFNREPEELVVRVTAAREVTLVVDAGSITPSDTDGQLDPSYVFELAWLVTPVGSSP